MHSDLYSDNLDSVTNNLRDSAKGSNDGYDVAFPLTREEELDSYTKSQLHALAAKQDNTEQMTERRKMVARHLEKQHVTQKKPDIIVMWETFLSIVD